MSKAAREAFQLPPCNTQYFYRHFVIIKHLYVCNTFQPEGSQSAQHCTGKESLTNTKMLPYSVLNTEAVEQHPAMIHKSLQQKMEIPVAI